MAAPVKQRDLLPMLTLPDYPQRQTARSWSRGVFSGGVFRLILLLWFAGWNDLVAAPDPIITEFLAANSSGLPDEDGDRSDWIELYNPGVEPVSLGGWHLTDSVEDLTKWEFPAVTLPGQGFLVVFASEKDRRDPLANLHTNFKLNREGEYLALVRPDGVSVACAFAPVFPRQLSDVSYGVAMTTATEWYVPTNGAARLWVPSDDRWGNAWVQPDFVEAGWMSVPLGIGYERPLGAGDPVEPSAEMSDVTTPGDYIVPTSSNSPSNEGVENAIDDLPSTKYLNFDKLNAGMTVTPGVGRAVVTGLRLTSANDAPERDPTSYQLLGSDDGAVFTEIARGSLPSFAGRFVTVAVSFPNQVAYRHYRLLFPTVADAGSAVAVQIAEVEFLGLAGPLPPAFPDLIKTQVEGAMFGKGTSAYARMPFAVAAVPTGKQLALDIRYDDGFVAYLNGVEVARANAPAALAFDAAAVTNRYRSAAVQQERFSLSAHWDLVRAGTNVLAIHGLNDRAASAEFLLQPELKCTGVALGAAAYFGVPTPGRENGVGSVDLVSGVVFSRSRGFCDEPFDLVLSCATPGVTIRFTTDGSEPGPASGQVYQVPIRVGRTMAVRAAAFREGWWPSRVATHSYLFLDDIVQQTHASTLAAGFPAMWADQGADYGLDPRVVGANGQDSYGGKYAQSLRSDLRAVPSLCLAMELDDLFGPQGIYAYPENRGSAWERPVSVELIDAKQQAGFQEDAGLRIQGGAFRRFDLTLKKSFRLVFREKYGSTTLRYPWFGPDAADRFDNIVLRANSNDGWPYFGGSCLYIRDAFAMESARAMGRVASHSSFVHLYINGIYWGLYNPVERPDAAFSAAYYGGDKETWDALNQDSVPDGTADAWNSLLALLNLDVSQDAIYQRLQGNNPDGTRNPDYPDLLDVDNMIDYLILNFYAGNTDWPHRNWWVGRNRDNGDGFKFYPWDTETALGVTGLSVDVTGASGAVARPYAALRANADFRMQFADRVYRHFSPGGAFYVNPASPAWDPAHPENNRPAARFAALADIVDRAIVGESARWGDQKGTGPFTRDEHWQKERDNLLANFFPGRSAIVLEQFRNAGLYPAVDPPLMSQQGGTVPAGYPLTLSSAQGAVYYTTNGTDPRIPVTVEILRRQTLLSNTAPVRALVPSSANGGAALGTSWRGGQEPFDDSAWQAGNGGVGYEQASGYESYIQVDVRSAMAGANGSAFIRVPFDYDGAGRENLNFMILRMRYDDGFVAFLNGVKIASANDPSDLQWNSVAIAQNPDGAAVVFEEFKVDAGLAALKTGRNILAIHGLNVSLGSSDFLIASELEVGERKVTTGTNSATLYAAPLVLNDLTTVKARVFDGLEWSALNEATFVVGQPALSVSELHYHPADPTSEEVAAGWVDADQFEFIELCNSGTGTFELEGVRFTMGIRFDFTGSSVTRLPAGAYVLVVKSRAAFEQRYGPGLPIAGEYAGQLDNAGERVVLVGAQGQTLLDFTYGTRSPWPAAADGFGPSLEVVDPEGDPASAGTWQASTVDGGSPGGPNALPPLALQVVGFEGAALRVRFEGRAGAGYTLYLRDSMSSGVWQILERGEPLAQDQPVELRLELSTNTPARFFQVSIP